MWKALALTTAIGAVVTIAMPAQVGRGGTQAAGSEDGRALYATYCASCHGRNGHGDGPVAESFKVRPPNLTQLARPNGGLLPAEQLRRIIDGRDPRARSHGPIGMPVWGDAFIRREGLSEAAARARIEAIVRYLDSVQERSS